MTAGDVVNGMSSANSILDFQPASGVECIIRDWYSSNSGESPNLAGLYDSTSGAYAVCTFAGAGGVQAYSRIIFITNTRYLRLRAAGAGHYNGYSGLQIK